MRSEYLTGPGTPPTPIDQDSSVGLVTTALLGLWMGLTHLRHRSLAWALFGLGAALPILLLVV